MLNVIPLMMPCPYIVETHDPLSFFGGRGFLKGKKNDDEKKREEGKKNGERERRRKGWIKKRERER